MQNKTKYRNSLVSKSLPIKKRFFVSCSFSIKNKIDYVFYTEKGTKNRYITKIFVGYMPIILVCYPLKGLFQCPPYFRGLF